MLKEYGSLTIPPYWQQFIQWTCQPAVELHKDLPFSKLKELRRRMMVGIHVLHKDNDIVHPSKSMFSLVAGDETFLFSIVLQRPRRQLTT